MLTKFAAAAALAIAAATPAAAEVLDFQGISGNFASPYTLGSATFTSSEGALLVGTLDFSGSSRICASYPVLLSCDATLGVSFAAPVSDLSFVVGGLDALSSTVSVTLSFLDGTSQAFSFTNFANSNFNTIDFSALADITGFTASSNDNLGVTYDDLRFTADVPEPATWAMMIGGLGLIGGAARRRAALRFA